MIHLIDEMTFDAQTTFNFLDLLSFHVSGWHATDKEHRHRQHHEVSMRTPSVDDFADFEMHGSPEAKRISQSPYQQTQSLRSTMTCNSMVQMKISVSKDTDSLVSSDSRLWQ